MKVNLPISERQLQGELIKTCSGRDLRDELGVTKDYTAWAKAQIKRARLVENRDYLLTQEGEQLPSGTKWRSEYHFSIDAGKHIAMMCGTQRGSEVRDYFLDCEKKAKGIPPVKDPQIAAVIFALTRVDAVEQEQKRQAEELARMAESVAVIEARTQPENKHFTVMGYANLVGMSVDTRTAATLGKRCAALSRQQGLVIGNVKDPRFGNVHSYHESVLKEIIPGAIKKAA